MSAAVASKTLDDGTRTYPYPPTGEHWPSVTTITGGTTDKPQLVPWSGRVTAEHIFANFDTYAAMLAPDGEGLAAAVKHASKEADRLRRVKAEAGSYVHKVIEALVLWNESPAGRGSDVGIPDLPEHLTQAQYDGDPLVDVVDWMNQGFCAFWTHYRPQTVASEMTVYLTRLHAAGTLDLIVILRDVEVVYRGGRLRLVPCPGNTVTLLIDVKTGRWLGAEVYEQLTAYRHGDECLASREGLLAPMPQTDYAAVLHCRPDYEGGYRLRIIPKVDEVGAWNRFRRAVDLYEGRRPYKGRLAGNVVYPVAEDGTVQPAWLSDLAEEGYRRLCNLLRERGLETVADVARFTAEDLRAVRGIGPKLVDQARVMLAGEDLALAGESLPDVTAEAAQLEEVA